MNFEPTDLWAFLPRGYAVTVLVELPILYLLLSAQHSASRRVLCGFWLTLCTYPVVVLVLPLIFDPVNERFTYLATAETFAPLAECLLFWLAFGTLAGLRTIAGWWDMGVITMANVASFLLGEAGHYWNLI